MDALNDLLPRLEQLNQIGAALSDERDIDRLLQQTGLGVDRVNFKILGHGAPCPLRQASRCGERPGAV